MATPRYDKDSCLFLLNKTAILESDICSKCRRIKGKSKKILKRNNIEWQGICLRLQNQVNALLGNEGEGPNENNSTCYPNRNPKPVERFVAAPTSNMRNHNYIPTRAVRRRPLGDLMNMKDLAQILKQNPRKLKELNQEMTNNPSLCIPRGG